MELGLSLGSRGVEIISNNNYTNNHNDKDKINGGFCMGLERSTADIKLGDNQDQDDDSHSNSERRREKAGSTNSSLSPLPRPPQLPFPWLPENYRGVSSEPVSSDGGAGSNRPRGQEEAEEQSSPNSGTSSFMEFSLYTSTTNSGGLGGGGQNGNNGKNYGQEEVVMMIGLGGRGGGSDDDHDQDQDQDHDDNGLLISSSTRKKLRLSKEQSAFLEESFKEHHTLNPKQKLALAKQLNLRPRQVEVWFQNRRARTKLKQTEVDCEYLKRCCETLTEENRRLQKELQELRALKSSQPFFMHLPATTLTMCPSCERVAPTSSSSAPASIPAPGLGSSSTTLSLGNKPKPKPMLLPFSNTNPPQAHRAAS